LTYYFFFLYRQLKIAAIINPLLGVQGFLGHRRKEPEKSESNLFAQPS
jgi:hypothetical protein